MGNPGIKMCTLGMFIIGTDEPVYFVISQDVSNLYQTRSSTQKAKVIKNLSLEAPAPMPPSAHV